MIRLDRTLRHGRSDVRVLLRTLEESNQRCCQRAAPITITSCAFTLHNAVAVQETAHDQGVGAFIKYACGPRVRKKSTA